MLSINGQGLRGVTHAEATGALRQTRSLMLAVVVVGKKAETEGAKHGGSVEESGSAGTPTTETSLSIDGRDVEDLVWDYWGVVLSQEGDERFNQKMMQINNQ